LTGDGTLLGAVAAAGGGDSFANNGSEFFYIKNGGGAGITVTFDAPGTCSFNSAANAAHDKACTIGAGEERIIGSFPTGRFNDANGLVQVTYSAVTSVTVAVLKA
jgi:hypothetical protein